MQLVQELLAGKSANLFSVVPDSAVYDAIKQMAEQRIGALLVMRGAELVGIVSERDYARKVILMGRSSRETKVEQIMSSPVVTVRPDTRIRECMQTMTDKRIRHLPVVEGGRVIGMLSIGDLLRAVLEDQQRTISELENYIRS